MAPFRVLSFIAIMLAALALASGLGHLMELPARLGWDQYLWVGATVQGGLYQISGTVGALLSVLATISLIVLAVMVRRDAPSSFRLTAAAALLYLVALVLWWVLVYPVNVELAKWVNGAVPADWTSYRSRWEWGHAFQAIVELIGFGLLIWASLGEARRGF